MKKIAKTNAARLLDQANVSYELVAYEVDENDLSATHLAATIGEDIDTVFKTLVLRGDKTGHFVCIVFLLPGLICIERAHGSLFTQDCPFPTSHQKRNYGLVTYMPAFYLFRECVLQIHRSGKGSGLKIPHPVPCHD